MEFQLFLRIARALELKKKAGSNQWDHVSGANRKITAGKTDGNRTTIRSSIARVSSPRCPILADQFSCDPAYLPLFIQRASLHPGWYTRRERTREHRLKKPERRKEKTEVSPRIAGLDWKLLPFILSRGERASRKSDAVDAIQLRLAYIFFTFFANACLFGASLENFVTSNHARDTRRYYRYGFN